MCLFVSRLHSPGTTFNLHCIYSRKTLKLSLEFLDRNPTAFPCLSCGGWQKFRNEATQAQTLKAHLTLNKNKSFKMFLFSIFQNLARRIWNSSQLRQHERTFLKKSIRNTAAENENCFLLTLMRKSSGIMENLLLSVSHCESHMVTVE